MKSKFENWQKVLFAKILFKHFIFGPHQRYFLLAKALSNPDRCFFLQYISSVLDGVSVCSAHCIYLSLYMLSTKLFNSRILIFHIHVISGFHSFSIIISLTTGVPVTFSNFEKKKITPQPFFLPKNPFFFPPLKK